MAQPDPSGSPAVVPTTEKEPTHSGRLLLRMPPSLHAELAREAEREGVSLNAFISSALSGAVRWRARADAGAAPGPARSRLLTVALALDVVLVAAAAILAVVLLLVA